MQVFKNPVLVPGMSVWIKLHKCNLDAI